MRRLSGLFVCLGFFSRLPVPAATEGHPHDLASAVIWVPVAGLLVGLPAALVLVAALAVALPPLLAATLAVATLVSITGALHEDGLADCADGFGGGTTIERKLEIMRDSRIGAFGACALALALLARVIALGAVAARSPAGGAVALLAAAALSRTACLLPLVTLPPARPDGLGASAGRPKPSRFLAAVLLACGSSAAVLVPGFGLARAVAAPALALLGAQAVAGVARRQIGGVTGDVAGAAQQVAEIAVLAVLAASSTA